MNSNDYDSTFSAKENEYKGKFEAEVVDNNDPMNAGRLLVKAYKIMDEVDFWARPSVPFAGTKSGFYMLPEIGSRVWIEFAGYLDDPIWTGCLWLESDAKELPTGNQKTKPHKKIIQSTSGMRLEFDDEEEKVTITGKDEENKVVIDVLEGKITIKSSSKVEIDAKSIDLGKGASNKIVNGPALISYLNTTIPMLRPIASPPPLPNSTVLLSNTVKSK